MTQVVRLLVVLLTWTACGHFHAAEAQEWTRFRGPNGTGKSEAKTIPTRWSEDDYNWKVQLPAAGHSSPVLWGEKIFLTCADDDPQGTAERLVVCLAAKDGAVLWYRKFESEPHKKHRFNSFASSTPAVDEERVYVVWSTPEEYTLLALDHEGRELWRRDLGPYVSQHSSGVSPIVYGDLVILPNDQDLENETEGSPGGKSFILAVDRKTGQTVWKVDRRSARVAYSTPCVYRPEGGPDGGPDGGAEQLIFNSMSHGVTSLDPEDGSQNWEIDAVAGDPLLTMRSVSSPVITDGGRITASCGSGAGGNYLVAVRPGTKSQAPEVVYKVLQRNAAPYVPTPLAHEGMLFLIGDKGIASCLDSSSGEAHWVKRLGGNFFGSPVLVDGRLFVISVEGDVLVIEADQEYELLATNPLGEMSHATPAVADGRMYLRTYRHLISVGGR